MAISPRLRRRGQLYRLGLAYAYVSILSIGVAQPTFILILLRPCENSSLRIVSTGIYYALALCAAGALVFWLVGPWFAVPMALLALFCLYFFRDPEREIPSGPVAVSPADGKVVTVKPEGGLNRLSIFLNVFDVHVMRRSWLKPRAFETDTNTGQLQS
jgi:Phosphatidylserine decarboxylase